MYVTNNIDLNTTNDEDNNTDLNTSIDYNSITNKCTITENIINTITSTMLLTIPCGLSFYCLMSLVVYTLIKPLFNNK